MEDFYLANVIQYAFWILFSLFLIIVVGQSNNTHILTRVLVLTSSTINILANGLYMVKYGFRVEELA